MKWKFESNLKHQDDAIKSVIDIFSGIETKTGVFSIFKNQLSLLSNNNQNIGHSNKIQTSDWLYIAEQNLENIQKNNGLQILNKIDKDIPTFDIEMETGTGKTYVFLKTILELNRNYDFKKFIIVVPSIAIKEGILKSLKMTRNHFEMLYPSVKYNYYEYDGQSLQNVWNFSNNNSLEIMIVNISSINKKSENNKNSNIFYREQDYLSGDKPIDLISQSNPIVIIDEPQSTASSEESKSWKAIKELNPLFILRYSATFRQRKNENLVYKLDSIDAFNKGLVKEIIVFGQEIKNKNENAYIKLISLNKEKQEAKIELKVNVQNKGTQFKKITIKGRGDDLYKISKNLDEYRDLRVDNINFLDDCIELSNGKEIKLQSNSNEDIDKEIKKTQIKTTIERHLQKQLELKKYNIKVLSLFFIDKVSKYREIDENGNVSLGEYGKIFEEEFKKIVAKKKEFQSLFDFSKQSLDDVLSKIHDGYFSVDKKNSFKDTKGDSKEDSKTYDKIMKDKEKLISFKEPLSFIWSHSALREGWDNPNVFQICTLNDTKSNIKKRQEIGRGLRLCINQDGDRVLDSKINTLSVITNESYEDFVETLQKEMKEDGVSFGKIEPHSFSEIESINHEKSRMIYFLFKNKKILDKNDFVISNDYSRSRVEEALKENNICDENVINSIIKVLEKSNRKIDIKNGKNLFINEDKKEVIESEEFKKLWNSIKSKTIYNVEFETQEFIYETKIKFEEKINDIESTKIVVQKNELDIQRTGIDSKKSTYNVVDINESSLNTKITDIVSDIENAVGITRKTIVAILRDYSILESIKRNPEQTKNMLIKIMDYQKRKMMVNGIEYKKIDTSYEQKILEKNGEKIFVGKIQPIDTGDSDKYPHKYIVVDSMIENNFGNNSLDSNIIKKFVKLPKSFSINTPLGKYSPDWALYDNNEIIMVAETKGTTNDMDLRDSENLKIKCGKKHFEAINPKILFEKTTSLEELLIKQKGDKNE